MTLIKQCLRFIRHQTAIATVWMLAACAVPSPNSHAELTVAQPLSQATAGVSTPGCQVLAADLLLPTGVDTERLRLIDSGKPVRVYVEALRFGAEGPNAKALFPSHMASLADFSKLGLTRLLADTILQSRRYEVYDISSQVTSDQVNYIISSQIVEAVIRWQPIEGQRQRAQVRVTMSLQMLDTQSGQLAFPGAVLVEGRTGTSSGDGTVVGPMDDVESPATQRKLAADYHNALRRAFREAGLRIGDIVRPIASVRNSSACDVDLFGGSRFGMQPRDELVLFRATTERMGDKEVLSGTQPVARVRCDSVGTDYMKCRIVAVVAGQRPQKGDYGIVTDASMNVSRQE